MPASWPVPIHGQSVTEFCSSDWSTSGTTEFLRLCIQYDLFRFEKITKSKLSNFEDSPAIESKFYTWYNHFDFTWFYSTVNRTTTIFLRFRQKYTFAYFTSQVDNFGIAPLTSTSLFYKVENLVRSSPSAKFKTIFRESQECVQIKFILDAS